jgi:hypothetical protein
VFYVTIGADAIGVLFITGTVAYTLGYLKGQPRQGSSGPPVPATITTRRPFEGNGTDHMEG